MAARQQLDAQLSENNVVQEVCLLHYVKSPKMLTYICMIKCWVPWEAINLSDWLRTI
jgi:hypothetical protein